LANNRPRYEEALNRGAMYRSKQMWQEAFSAYRVAIAEFPNEATPYAGLGEACLGLKQLDRALECFKLAAKYSNGDVIYLKRIADIQERQGQLSEAAKTYTAAGEYLMRQQDLEEAIGNWERAIRLDSTLLGPHRRLAMIFQRQNKKREAVREYLAIARILQTQGDKQKAFQMCQAALRLDPGNKDVLTAVDLIRHGAEGFAEPEPEEIELPTVSDAEQEEADALTATVRQMAAIFEAEARQKKAASPVTLPKSDPVQLASRLAQEQLSEEIFREEDDNDATVAGRTGLSKLERDALIGQAMDFESRRQTDEAIRCYERALGGGLTMTAAYYSLGLLYLQKGESDKARRVLGAALKDPAYTEAVKLVYARSQKPA
jgi:tetratricopeptide (TPR) repeat protein